MISRSDWTDSFRNATPRLSGAWWAANYRQIWSVADLAIYTRFGRKRFAGLQDLPFPVLVPTRREAAVHDGNLAKPSAGTLTVYYVISVGACLTSRGSLAEPPGRLRFLSQ